MGNYKSRVGMVAACRLATPRPSVWLWEKSHSGVRHSGQMPTNATVHFELCALLLLRWEQLKKFRILVH